MRRLILGASLKAYLGYRAGREWLTAAADIVRERTEVADGDVGFFVAPSYLQLPHAVAAFRGSGAVVGAQDVAAEEPGPHTGEVTAAELAEAGVGLAEIGHAERRRSHGETDAVVAAKTAAATRHGLTALVCVGEAERVAPEVAAALVVRQAQAALDAASGEVVLAYEPVWAIGAPEPAPAGEVREVVARVREALGRPELRIVYGGSAGPGMLAALRPEIDGLFLGRSVHDPRRLSEVFDEVRAFRS